MPLGFLRVLIASVLAVLTATAALAQNPYGGRAPNFSS